jgi:hypothetical protein
MARPLVDVIVELKIEYVPIPKAKVAAWRVGFSLLLQFIKRERELYDWRITATVDNGIHAWVLGRGTVHRIRLADWSVHYARPTHG